MTNPRVCRGTKKKIHQFCTFGGKAYSHTTCARRFSWSSGRVNPQRAQLPRRPTAITAFRIAAYLASLKADLDKREGPKQGLKKM